MKACSRFTKWLGLGLAVGALTASAAQAVGRPDDRAGMRGVDPQTATTAQGARPDDRAGPLGVGVQQSIADQSDVISRYLGNHPTALRPDDRGGIRGVGPVIAMAPNQGGFSWGSAAVGAGIALGVLAAALGVSALVRHRHSETGALQS